jgi:hypothetical protein
MKLTVVAGALHENHFFIDLVIPLYYCLQELGYECELLPLASQVDCTIANMCIGIFLHIDALPQNYIAWNLEPLSSGSPHLTQRLVRKLVNARALLHYNPLEIDFVKRFNPNVMCLPFSYHKSLENMYNLNLPIIQDIDVLFYGTPTEYRLRTIETIKNAGINIVAHTYNSVYAKQRDEYICRSKIVLLINVFDNNPDMVRLVYLLSQKKCIVVDKFGNDTLINVYNSFPIVENSMLVDTIQQLLADENKRNEIANNSYQELISKPDMRSHLSNLHISTNPVPEPDMRSVLSNPSISPNPASKLLVLYVFHVYNERVDHFINKCIFYDADTDFIIIVNDKNVGNLQNHIFSKNVKLLYRDNIGYDFGGWSEALLTDNLYNNYDNFIFVNSSVIGPFIPSNYNGKWTDIYINGLQNNVQLFGSTINTCRKPLTYSHVQSYIFSMNKIALQHLIDCEIFSVTNYAETFEEAVWNKEVLMSRTIINNGWNIGSLFKYYNGVDFTFKNKTPEECNIEFLDDIMFIQHRNVLWNEYQLVFIKGNRCKL